MFLRIRRTPVPLRTCARPHVRSVLRPSVPQDAFEPLRRMCRWVSDEDYDVAQELRIGGA